MSDPQAVSVQPWWWQYVFPVVLSIAASVTVAVVSSWLSARRERTRMIQARAFQDRLDWYLRISSSMSALMFLYNDSIHIKTQDEAGANIAASLVHLRKFAAENIEAYLYAPVKTIRLLTKMKANLELLLEEPTTTIQAYRLRADKIRNELGFGHLELARYMREILGLDELPDDLG